MYCACDSSADKITDSVIVSGDASMPRTESDMVPVGSIVIELATVLRIVVTVVNSG